MPLTHGPTLVSVYTVTDQERVAISEDKWSLSGDDAAMFELADYAVVEANNNDPAMHSITLEFKEEADFEIPGDKNKDNIYEVTVAASDGENRSERAVRVKIIDSDEQGEIMLSDLNPVTSSEITATLEDSDGDVTNEAWTWYALDTTQAGLLESARNDPEADPPAAIDDVLRQ